MTQPYPAAHGWMIPDFLVHDPVAAERGWTEMLALFGLTLHGGRAKGRRRGEGGVA